MGPDHLTPAEKGALERFVKAVRAEFGDRVERLVLFGSRARGEGHEESDVDVLVLVRGVTWQERYRIIDFATDIWRDTWIDISPLVRTPEDFAELERRELLIAEDINREGIPL